MDADRTVFSSPQIAAMDAAIDAAHGGMRGANPLVGAAVLSPDGSFVTGFHRGAGTAHAEVDAVLRARSAGVDLSRATLLVTLEPCSHTGRTGPCTEFIADSGIRRVIYASSDPNPAAAGGGARLRELGVEVASGLAEERAAALNARWVRAMAEGRPFVTLKIAQSLDGRIAAADGTSRWITSDASRSHAHAVRARVDAILVGSGTVVADDPRLTARDPGGREPAVQPVPVVLGERDVPAGSRLGRNPRTIHVRSRDPRAALSALTDAGLRHVLVEGGATVAGAFLSADLVDEVHLYLAPLLLGPGTPSVEGLGITTLTDAVRFTRDPAGPEAPDRLGPDAFLRLVPETTVARPTEARSAASDSTE